MAEAMPLVFKKGGKQRLGKGFSLGELKEVKLSLKQALKLGIPVDSRRRTVHENNVKSLKEFLATIVKPKKTSKPAVEKTRGKAKSGKEKKNSK
ncbi:MAG: ribosomal protein L13e [Candidatus Bathyarchaeia archaeon]